MLKNCHFALDITQPFDCRKGEGIPYPNVIYTHNNRCLFEKVNKLPFCCIIRLHITLLEFGA
uniref:Uncharacterized protein n=1 Tax=Anguilla anguilla TaxID=7936 RepID=A0A0E9W8F2_ANGAN